MLKTDILRIKTPRNHGFMLLIRSSFRPLMFSFMSVFTRNKSLKAHGNLQLNEHVWTRYELDKKELRSTINQRSFVICWLVWAQDVPCLLLAQHLQKWQLQKPNITAKCTLSDKPLWSCALCQFACRVLYQLCDTSRGYFYRPNLQMTDFQT